MTRHCFRLSYSQFIVAIGLLLALASCNAPASSEPSQPEAISGVLAVSELITGDNRFAFAIVSVDGHYIDKAVPSVRFFLLREDGTEQLKVQADAAFREMRGVTPHTHEDSFVHMHENVQGIYVVDRVSFDEPGYWRARFQISRPEGLGVREGSLAFEVRQESATFRVGDSVPPSRNPVAQDVNDLAEITSHATPVVGLYEMTVAEALQDSKPFVVVFATPAFCISRMCGPVTDVVAQVYEIHKDEINFIHIEPWVLNLAREQGRLVLTHVAEEWRLPSEPWVFVVGSNGRILARFEGLVTVEELEAALR